MENTKEQELKQQGVSVFKSVLSNKADLTANQVIDQLKEGNADPLYIFTILKRFAKIQETVFKDEELKEKVIEELKLYLGKTKTAELFNAKITLASGNRWDYSNVDDPYLNAMETIVDQLNVLIKARKEELESKATVFHNRKPEEIIGLGNDFKVMVERMPRLEWDDETEVYIINPPVLVGKETLRFTV